VFNLDEEKGKLTEKLAEQFSQNIMDMEEYERILEYINKIETKREISIIEKIMTENHAGENHAVVDKSDAPAPEKFKKHVTVFSTTTSYIDEPDENGGEHDCYFGENKIIANNLPKGKTVLNIKTIFGETKIIIEENIKITNKIIPLFSEITDTALKTNADDDDLPELYITGKVIFGDIKIIDERSKQTWKKVGEKIMKKIIDTIDKI
jgi:hypothetical protein